MEYGTERELKVTDPVKNCPYCHQGQIVKAIHYYHYGSIAIKCPVCGFMQYGTKVNSKSIAQVNKEEKKFHHAQRALKKAFAS